MFLSEVWGDSHWADAHIQLPEWSDYRADFSLLNGRVYPDTLLPERLDRPSRRRPRSREPQLQRVSGAGRQHQLGPGGPGRAPRPRQPAELGPDHLQCRRAGPPAVRQPGFRRGGDDPRRHPDAGRRQGRHAHARSHRLRHQLRDEHSLVRRRREHRRDLHRPAPLGRRRPRRLRALQPRLHPRRQPGRTAAASGRRCASTRPAPCRPRSTPTSTRTTRRETDDERSDDDETIHALAAPLRAGARGVVGAGRQRAAVRRDRPADRGSHGGFQPERRRVHDGQRRGHQPDLQPDHPRRVHQPRGRHHCLHVGVLGGQQALPAPGARAVRQRG